MERELCLHVPITAQASITAAMHGQNAQSINLRALYFDTAARALALAGAALRLRLEGDQWVQTVKAAGHDPLSRIEINHPRSQAQIDLALYEDSPLANLFASLREPLELRYETDIKRQVARAQRSGTVIEIAYDEGAVHAGGWSLPVCELEFELVSGNMSDLFDMAQEWLSTHGLILEIRSKAQRGDRLAELRPATTTAGPAVPPTLFKARRAKRLSLAEYSSDVERYLACAGECLVQIMANASLLAGVDTREASDAERAEQLHQLRRGVRRLRACWTRYPAFAPPIAPLIAQEFGGKRPENLQAIAAGPRFQSVLLNQLRELVRIGDCARSKTAASNDTQR